MLLCSRMAVFIVRFKLAWLVVDVKSPFHPLTLIASNCRTNINECKSPDFVPKILTYESLMKFGSRVMPHSASSHSGM